MIKNICIFCVCFILPIHLFASEDIQVFLSSEKVIAWEIVNLQIDIDVDSIDGETSIDVPGIEAFQVFSQSQGQSYRSVNGETQGTLQYSVWLRALGEWNYSIGPVVVFSWTGSIVDDETLEIEVKAMKAPLVSEAFSDWKEEVSETVALRWLRKPELSNIFFILLFVVFLCGFYYILQKSLFQKTQKEALEAPEIPRVDSHAILLNYFKKLERKTGDSSSQDFFTQLNSWMRQIFFHEWWSYSTKATLKELKKDKRLVQHELFSIFERSYNHEFSWKEIGTETRKKYVKDIISYLS